MVVLLMNATIVSAGVLVAIFYPNIGSIIRYAVQIYASKILPCVDEVTPANPATTWDFSEASLGLPRVDSVEHEDLAVGTDTNIIISGILEHFRV